FQNNAGGAWDNAKKSFEKGVEIEGQIFYKKSEPHKAAVIGDTVGDTFKDTSGPSMNILIKLTSLVGLTIAPLIAIDSKSHHSSTDKSTQVTATQEIMGSLGQSLGSLMSVKLGDISLNLPEKGIENQLLSYLKDSSNQLGQEKWFDFDRLTFKTNSHELEQSSEEQLNNIVAILKGFPNSQAKIGGYTDKTGNSADNLALSQKRADFVMNALISKGIAADRLSAKGYGDTHQICEEDSDACRAKNRRIALQLSTK
nr:sodium/proton-translocating pyrophosphatase [Chitinophagales bacterium]